VASVRWFGLVIVTIVVAAGQTTVGHLMAINKVTPSFLLIAAVYYGFRWPTAEAGIAGWALGLAADLTGITPIGSQSLTYALAAMSASRLRLVLMTNHPMAQILVTGILGWLAYSVVSVHGAWQGGWKVWSFGASLERAGWVALYTAVLAPYLFWLLERFVPLLGLQPHTRRR
jgi:rod shape-determining protein MreD